MYQPPLWHAAVHSFTQYVNTYTRLITKPLVYTDTSAEALAALDLAHKLTTHSVAARITATAALEHPFLTGLQAHNPL